MWEIFTISGEKYSTGGLHKLTDFTKNKKYTSGYFSEILKMSFLILMTAFRFLLTYFLI